MPPPEMQSAARLSGSLCTAVQIAFKRVFRSVELGKSGGNSPCNTANSASSTSCNGTDGLADEGSFAMTRKRGGLRPTAYQAGSGQSIPALQSDALRVEHLAHAC